MQSKRLDEFSTLEAHLEEKAERLRQRAKRLPPGEERERILREADEVEKTCSMVDWINSPGLKPPS